MSLQHAATVDFSSGEEEEALEPMEMIRKRACGISAEAHGAWNHRRAAFVPTRYKHNKEDEEGLANAFQNCPLFAHIEHEVLSDVIRCMPLVTLQPSEYVVRQGEQGDSLFV